MGKVILIVDDDELIREFIFSVLEQNGFVVYEAASGEEALESLPVIKPELVLLDIKLPGLDVFEICRILRSKYPDMGVIMLTAYCEKADIVRGLELGADDYIVKPFDASVILARVKAVLRRLDPNYEQDKVIYCGNLQIIPNARRVIQDGVVIELTPREYDLLLLLVKNPNGVFSREELLNQIWGQNFWGEHKTVDVTISRLRAKLKDDPTNPRLIKTVRGVGYLLDPGSLVAEIKG